MHGKIITWDNLTKRGYFKPSIFSLCQQQMKRMEHILGGCPYSKEIWNQKKILFNKWDLQQHSVQNVYKIHYEEKTYSGGFCKGRYKNSLKICL